MATWTIRPNSVLPANMRAQLPFGGESDPLASMTNAWVTSVVDTNRGRVILARTGGHADGAHNGVRAYGLTSNTWSFLKTDSLAYTRIGGTETQPNAAYTARYGDGTPASVHSYDACCYMPPPFDEIWSAGGIYWSPPGSSNGVTFGFSLASNAWRDLPTRPGGYGTHSVWDPVGQQVLIRTSGGLFAYRPVVGGPGTYVTLVSPVGGDSETSTLALDEVGRKVYYNARHSAAPFRIRMIDLNNLALKEQSITTTGNTEIGALPGLGLFFDGGRLIAYGKNAALTGGTLYTLNPATGVWTRLTTTGTAPLPSTTGTWKKFFKYNGTYNLLHSTGIYTITPDGGTVPVLVSIKVATDFTINALPTEPPPPPPTPPGGTSPLTVNTWTMVPALPSGTPVTTRAGKHIRVVWDSARLRHLIAGGDRFGSDGGQPAVHAWDSLTGLATLLSPTCVPAPALMPNFPDNVCFCYDSRRDRFLMFPGFYFKQPITDRPDGTLTPAAVSGTNVLMTASEPVFGAWHATANPAGGGFNMKETSTSFGSTVIADCKIVSYVSPTQVRADILTAFADTNPIAQRFWTITASLKGRAADWCNRNIYAGDTGVLDGDCIYNPQTNKWERPTWPVSPVGLGSDGGGPSWCDYDEVSDKVFMVKNAGPLMILHCATNTWEMVTFGAGMVAGAEKSLVTGRNSYRAQVQIANGVVYFMSNRTGGAGPALIAYTIATGAWHAWATPVGYVPPADDSEPQLVYDPVSNVLLHLNGASLTGDASKLYIFTIATSTWTERAVPVLAEPVKLGCSFWDPPTLSLGTFGRIAVGVPGYTAHHYRYAP